MRVRTRLTVSTGGPVARRAEGDGCCWLDLADGLSPVNNRKTNNLRVCRGSLWCICYIVASPVSPFRNIPRAGNDFRDLDLDDDESAPAASSPLYHTFRNCD